MDKKLVTILVVEDDDALREAICDALAFADFQTLPTAHGKEALAVLHGQHKIDLVLTDVEMPELGGLALLTEIKAQWPEMPVVLMTAFAQVSKRWTPFKMGRPIIWLNPLRAMCSLA